MMEKQLLRASRAGDRGAYGKLVERYQGLVRTVAYSATGDLALSEDIAQDAFVAAWGRLKELRDPASFRGWLCAIARNLSLRALRQRQRERRAHDGLVAGQATTAAPATPREQAISKEEQAMLWLAVEQMPEAYRIPLILYYREGQSVVRVGELLGLSPNAVKQRLFRGRGMLREEMARRIESAFGASDRQRAIVPGVLAALPTAPVGIWRALLHPLSQTAKVAPPWLGSKAGLGVVVVLAVLGIAAGPFLPDSRESVESETADDGVVDTRPSDDRARPEPFVAMSITAPEEAPSPDSGSASTASLEEDDLLAARRDRLSRAAATLAEAWRTRPADAAGLVCIKGWTYLAMLGEDEGRARLLDEIHELGEYAQNANWHMQVCLDDFSGEDYLRGIVADRRLPLDRRVLAYEQCVTVRPEDRGRHPVTVPGDIRAYYREKVLASGFNLQALSQFSAIASSADRRFLEEVLWVSAFEPSVQQGKTYGAGFSKLRRETLPAFGPTGLTPCAASRAMNALTRLGGAASTRFVRDVAIDGSTCALQRGAIESLTQLGDGAFGLDAAHAHLQDDLPIGERLQFATLLAENGDDTYRGLLYDALEHVDREVRERAYVCLCHLGDPAFANPASKDAGKDGRLLGFEALALADDSRMGFHLQGATGFMSDTFFGYLEQAVRERVTPEAAHQAAQMALSASRDQLVALLPYARTVLDESPVRLPRSGEADKAARLAWSDQLCRLVILLRVAPADMQETAMARIEGMYDDAPSSYRTRLALDLGWCGNRLAVALLARIVDGSPRRVERLIATRNLLAIEAGVVPE